MNANKLSMAEVVAIYNQESPARVLESIPENTREILIGEICTKLMENNLSFRQSEILLEIVKGRLLHWKMRD